MTTVQLTKITSNQAALLSTLAMYPHGASYERIKHFGMMVLSSVMVAGKPYVRKEMKAIHGDSTLTAVYALTESGIARQQNMPFYPKRVIETDVQLWDRVDAYTEASINGYGRHELEDQATWDYTRLTLRAANTTMFARANKAKVNRMIDALRKL